MSDEGKKSVNFDKRIEDRNTADGSAKVVGEVLGETLPEKVGGDYGRTTDLLAGTERLLTLRAEDVRVAAAGLTEDQRNLIRLYGDVRALALNAADLAQKMHADPQVGKTNLPSAARAAILLANILRQLREMSGTIATTIESQTATISELVKITGEAAKGSLCLAHKISTLAEETKTVLPPLENKNLVEVQLQWLAAELDKALTEFRSPQTTTNAGIDDVRSQLLAKPPVVN